MIRAIIFDCFGVLCVDPAFLAYRKLGGDVEKDRSFLERTLLASDAGQIPSAASVIAERLQVSETAWLQANQTAGDLDRDLLDYILGLRHTYKIGLLSNIGQGGLARWFDAGMLDKYFDVAIASGDIGFAKPEPEAYEIIAERLSVRLEECLMVDDRQLCCDGAQAIGMQAFLYTSFERLRRGLPSLLDG